MAIIYNILISNIFLLAIAVISKVSINLFHPPLRELLFSSEGLYAVLWGIRMDLAVVAALTTLCLLFDFAYCRFKPKNSLVGKLPLALSAIWLVITTVSDHIYLIESGRHVTFEVFTGAGEEWSLILTAMTQYTAQASAGLVLVALSLLLLRRISFSNPYQTGNIKSVAVALLIWPVIAVSAVRGGWSDAPQSPMSTYKISSNQLAELAWSAPYSISYYLLKGQKRAAQKTTPDLSTTELSHLASAFNDGTRTATSGLKQANVIIVLLESWAAADMQSYAGEINATPFFDELRKTSLTTKATYANGFRTVEGMFATLCSYPNPIGGGVAGTQLQNNRYQCLPQVLTQQGWETYFIQGSGKGIIGTFAQSLGFQFSHGKTDYSFDAPLNYWGYMDDSIYRFSLDKLKTAKRPYLMTINTGTTHDRSLPAGEDYVFGNADNDQARASVTHHADQALKRFITRLKQTETEPTLVILIADHTAGITKRGLSQTAIPFLMFALNDQLPSQKLDVVSSQRDISPTIIDWLGGRAPWFTGQSLLDSSYQGFADFSVGETMSWVHDDTMIQLNAKTTELEACYSVAEDTLTTTERECEAEPLENYHRARDYLLYSQQLLFDGRTIDYN